MFARLFFAAPFAFAVTASAATVVETVLVGNAGNAADATGIGSVSELYRIGTYEVTNAQYSEFLNAVDPAGANSLNLYNPSMGSDPVGGITLNPAAPAGARFELKSDKGNKPVNYVSFIDTMRFANWLQNGQGASNTEDGAYTVISGGLAGRNPGATVFIPSQNEWYKAAYFDPANPAADDNGTPDYWLFPTQSDSVPTRATADAAGDVTNPGSNVANYFAEVENVTTVGGTSSVSFFGTFDQAGNVREWNEAVIFGTNRQIRGGGFLSQTNRLQSTGPDSEMPEFEAADLGFRIAMVPEPSAAVAAILAGGLSLAGRRRQRALV